MMRKRIVIAFLMVLLLVPAMLAASGSSEADEGLLIETGNNGFSRFFQVA